MSEAHLPATCESCSTELQRIYSAAREPEFKGYYSGDCGTFISSRSQEKRELKKKGLMLYADTPGYEKWQHKIKEERNKGKKLTFFMGAK